MSNPAFIAPGNIESDVPADNDIENIRPGGSPLVFPVSTPTITITLNTRTELGTLEVLNPLSSNVDKYTVFVLDTGDITPRYIGEVSILIFNLPLTISKKKNV
jgi:hypothetical protein